MAERKPKSRAKRWAMILFWAVVGYFGICFVLAYMYVSRSRTLPVRPPSAEEVSISGAAYPVPAWATHGLEQGTPRSGTAFILVHGFGGNRQSWSQAFLDLQSAGYEVAVPEMPAHGASPDPKVGFGPKEAGIVLAVGHWIKHAYGDRKPRIVAVGVSMGGAACWLATVKEPDLFSAIVTESSFARLEEVSDRWFDRHLPGGHVILAPVKWFSEWLSGVKSSSVNPVEAARRWRGKPALVIHCAEDTLAARSHAERLRDASGAQFWEIPGAAHAQGYGTAREEYLRRLEALAER